MTNYVIIYDGTFVNLLSTIKYLIEEKIRPAKIVVEGKYNVSLFEEILKPNIFNDPNYIAKLENLSSKKVIKIITFVFLSNDKNKELILYYFILNTLKYKKNIIYYRNLLCVNQALKISKHVANENHKFKGFTRFQMVNNKFLFAKIKPDNYILESLSQHFSKRLKNELWIIKDEKHNILSIYDKKNFYIVNAKDLQLLELKNIEKNEKWEKLWKTFFNSIAIKERENRRCQMSFMPKKYWSNIIEMEGNDEKNN